MLRQIAEGVLVHESGFLQSHAVVVRGSSGVLLIDPGVTGAEMTCLANDLSGSGRTVVAGFSTHPHWDHLLWHPALGPAPRYGTAGCAASVEEQMADPDWKTREAEELPPEIADDVPLDLLGLIVGLPAGATAVPWDGPPVRIIEHRAHSPGHAALVVEDGRVLVAGDMLSDALIPFLDLSAPDPVGDYLAALELFAGVAGDVDVVVPGHGSVGGAEALRTRIDLDRAYVQAARDGQEVDDPRLAPTAANGEWLPDVDTWQRERIAERSGSASTSSS